MTLEPTSGPCTASALQAARGATLAALAASTATDGYGAARTALAALPAGELVDVAATLALLLGRPDKLLILDGDEWAALQGRWSS